MAGLTLAVDLLKTSGLTSKSLHSYSSLNALSAALSASVGVTFLPTFPASSPRFEYRDWTRQFAFCEEAQEAYTRGDPESRWLPESQPKNGPKAYNVELKPLFSAFKPRALGATAVRAFLLNFLPLLEAYLQSEEGDLEEDADRPASLPVDPIIPVKRSGTHILREVAVITTRRVLERATVHFASRRMAWKLLKDVPKSAVRKANRKCSKWWLFVGVTRTTFRGHALGVMANWVVQLVLDIFRFVRSSIPRKQNEVKKQAEQNTMNDFNKLMRKSAGNTLKGGASLVLASVGAGIGTIVTKPSIGTWIGCALGDLAGQYLIGVWLDEWIFYGTFSPPRKDP